MTSGTSAESLRAAAWAHANAGPRPGVARLGLQSIKRGKLGLKKASGQRPLPMARLHRRHSWRR